MTRNSFDIDEENFHSFFFSIDKKRNRKETGWIHMLSFYAVHEKMILPSKRIGSKNESTHALISGAYPGRQMPIPNKISSEKICARNFFKRNFPRKNENF